MAQESKFDSNLSTEHEDNASPRREIYVTSNLLRGQPNLSQSGVCLAAVNICSHDTFVQHD